MDPRGELQLPNSIGPIATQVLYTSPISSPASRPVPSVADCNPGTRPVKLQLSGWTAMGRGRSFSRDWSHRGTSDYLSIHLA